jgi:Pyruvate/2-oxoacid:ferredoxin oxidoreductase delta subunit
VGNAKDWIKVDDKWLTAAQKVYAGGDAVKLGLVTIAIGQARVAAEMIDAELRGLQVPAAQQLPVIKQEKIKLDWYQAAQRAEQRLVPVEERLSAAEPMTLETNLGVSREQVAEEAKRCLSCGMCMDCDNCWMYCTSNGFERLPKGQHYRIKLELCNGCRKCGEECPAGYIDLV